MSVLYDVRRRREITPSRVQELFSYDPELGELRAKTAAKNREIGLLYAPNGNVVVDGWYFPVSHICWVHYTGNWPVELIDHKNRNRSDIRIVNLREASYTQNQYNRVQANPHGYKGVTWRDRKKKPWLSKIRVDGVRINLGSFETKEEAAKAYEEACLKYHGEFAQLGIR